MNGLQKLSLTEKFVKINGKERKRFSFKNFALHPRTCKTKFFGSKMKGNENNNLKSNNKKKLEPLKQKQKQNYWPFRLKITKAKVS